MDWSSKVMRAEELTRLLEVVEEEIVPLTREGVAAGNKIFGAAVLRSDNLSLIVAGTNDEVASPLWHGEMVAIREMWELPENQRPAPEDCLLLSTHEPCPMCLAAIAWAALPQIYYLFSYEQTRDAFAIPHDLGILDEVFGCRRGDYARSNRYWQSHAILDLIERCPAPGRELLEARVESLRQIYRELSASYQAAKTETSIPRK